MKIIHLIWVDSYLSIGWRAKEELSGDNHPIESVGWLVNETDTTVTISTSEGCGGNVADCMTIPKSAISKRKYIKSVL